MQVGRQEYKNFLLTLDVGLRIHLFSFLKVQIIFGMMYDNNIIFFHNLAFRCL
jgi:hypothetical protein